MFRRTILFISILVMLAVHVTAYAQTSERITLTYRGKNFTSLSGTGPPTTSNYISVSIIVDVANSKLKASFTNTDVTLISWSMSDGANTVTNLTPSTSFDPEFSATPSANGLVVNAWRIQANSTFAAFTNGLTLYTSDAFFNDYSISSGGIASAPHTGTWSTSGYSPPPPSPLTITTTSLPDAVSGQSYSTTLAASGGQGLIMWSLASGPLPTGFALSSGGVLSSMGNPAATPNTYSFSVIATDGVQTTPPKPLSLVVRNVVRNPLKITTTSLPNALRGHPYSTTLIATGGQGNVFWSLAAGSILPVGFALSADGTLSSTGSPVAQAGTYNFIVVATDSTKGTDQKPLSLTVQGPIFWGAEVQVTLVGSDTPITDRLVSFDGFNIVLAGDVMIANDGTVTVGGSYSLLQVAQITLTNPNELYNQYIVLGDDGTSKSNNAYRTISLRQNAYSYSAGGVWSYTIESSGIGDDGYVQDPQQIDGLYAIPRLNGNNTDFGDVKTALNAAAVNNNQQIPPHILYGLAYQESRWQQFNNGTTLLSHDGGIGLCQLTGATAIWDSYLGPGLYFPPNPPPVQDMLTHLYRLSSDYAYNAKAGAKVLWRKFNGAPAFDDNNSLKLEVWYYALWGYNGYVASSNNPNVTNNTPYQEAVFDNIENNPLGMWTPVNISLPDYSDIGTKGLPNALPYTPALYHLATDFNGNIKKVTPRFTINIVKASDAPTGQTVVSLTITNDATNGMAAGHVALTQCTITTTQQVTPQSLDTSQMNLASGQSRTYTLVFSTSGTARGLSYTVRYTTGSQTGTLRF